MSLSIPKTCRIDAFMSGSPATASVAVVMDPPQPRSPSEARIVLAERVGTSQLSRTICARESRPEDSKIGLDFRHLPLPANAGNPALRRLHAAPAHDFPD